MAINIQAKTDYSYLFSSLNTSSKNNVGGNSFLIDYAMIKNGSYGKLMKAYYAESAGDEVKSVVNTSKVNNNSATSSDDTKTIAKVKSATDELKESADKLLEKGPKSVFAQDDMEKVYSAVNDFVKEAVMLGYSEIVIIHGIGSGIIKNTVQNALKANKNVLSFHISGMNIGCTVAKIKKL